MLNKPKTVVWCLVICSLGWLSPAVPYAAAQAATSALTPAELAAEAAPDALTPLDPVTAAEADEVVLDAIFENGYQDEQGRYVIDLLERDKAYLGVRITTPDGNPVVGAVPDITVDGGSSLLLSELASGEDGVMNFGVVSGGMGFDLVTARIGEAKIEFAVNVISLRATGFPVPEKVEGGLGWDELMQAQLEYKDMKLVATFPPDIKKLAGQRVKLSGFMMPLDPDLKQRRFLLTSNPPSCFFHVPGGPAGSVDVMAAEGIEVSWNPIVIEGRFEPQETSDIGVVYQLFDAKLVK